jgi:hypothetical protein
MAAKKAALRKQAAPRKKATPRKQPAPTAKFKVGDRVTQTGDPREAQTFTVTSVGGVALLGEDAEGKRYTLNPEKLQKAES